MEDKEIERRFSLQSNFISQTNAYVNRLEKRVKKLEDILINFYKAVASEKEDSANKDPNGEKENRGYRQKM